MGAGYGFTGHVGFGKETTYGTAVTVTSFVEALSENLALTKDRFDVRNIVGRYSEPDDMVGMNRIGGDLTFAANPESVAHFIYGTMGVQSNTVVLSGTLYRNAFMMATSEAGSGNPLPPYTFEIFRDVGSSQQFAGCIMSRLQLSVAPNQDLRAVVSLIGKSALNIAKTTPSFPGSPFDPLAFDTASISIGGAATTLVEALTLTIDNQLEGVPTLNSSSDIVKVRRTGPQMIRVSGSLAFEDIVDYQRFVNQTEFALKANFTRANSFSMLIDCPRVVYSAFPLGMSDRGRQVVSFEGIVRYNPTSARAMHIEMTTINSNF